MNELKLPGDILMYVCSFLTCCEQDCAGGGAERCLRRDYSSKCLRPKSHCMLSDAIAYREPGFEILRFRSRDDRSRFERWVKEKHLCALLHGYCGRGLILEKTLLPWEAGAFCSF